jgi:hypothetical protein
LTVFSVTFKSENEAKKIPVTVSLFFNNLQKNYVIEQCQTDKARFLQSLEDLNKPTNGDQSAVGISHEQLLHLGVRCTQRKQERLSTATEVGFSFTLDIVYAKLLTKTNNSAYM